MKKVIAVLFAALIMAFSAVPAFAAEGNCQKEYQSPMATPVPNPCTPATPCKKDTSSASPKTGSSDVAAYATIALSLAAAGALTLVYAKSGK